MRRTDDGPLREGFEMEQTLCVRGLRFKEFKTPFGPLGAMASKALMGAIPEDEAKASLQRLKALVEREGGVGARPAERAGAVR